jgi:hypothetical protein
MSANTLFIWREWPTKSWPFSSFKERYVANRLVRLRGFFHERAEVLLLHRLLDVVEGAEAERFHRVGYVSVRGDHQHEHGRILLLDRAESLEAGFFRHVHVEDRDREIFFLDLLNCVFAIDREHGFETHMLQRRADAFAQLFLVVGDEYFEGLHGGLVIRCPAPFVTRLRQNHINE